MKFGHLEGEQPNPSYIWGTYEKNPWFLTTYIRGPVMGFLPSSKGAPPTTILHQPPRSFLFGHLDAHHHIANVKLLMHRPRHSELTPSGASDQKSAGENIIPHTIHVWYLHLVDFFHGKCRCTGFSEIGRVFCRKKTETQKVKANVFQPSIFMGELQFVSGSLRQKHRTSQ